ncbi:hypothetical protein LOC71_21675 [Rhodopirellula sp. JC740]|uniref:Uncharacterized protein n=1 Tax=Rhodopirellula halodulae TaxID=2894198 RepID=A0ABS8NN15_9BACT|nr:hypothetical protein [Rhodopirellula sp. JC740]
MSRSLFSFGFVVACAMVSTTAHADLDSLLGKWTQEASEEQASGDSLVLNHANESDVVMPQHSVVASPTQTVSFPGQPSPVINPYVVRPSADCGGCDSAGPCQTPGCSSCGPKFNLRKHFGAGCSSCGELVEPGCQSCSSCGLGAKLKGLASKKDCNTCGEIVEGCQAGCNVGLSECRPHQAPALPPPSSILEYFRSRPSYSGIWAGYADETRTRCRNTSPHVIGNCDCTGGHAHGHGCQNGGCQLGNCQSGCDSCDH